ncbi:MAG: RNA-binding protein [Pseudomonadota bacterium]
MSRGGSNGKRTVSGERPERRCIVTGKKGAKRGLIRFVLGPENRIVPDLSGKLPGRGFWVVSDRKSIEKAAAKGLFAKAAKEAVTVPQGLSEIVEERLTERLVGLISLSRKAGGAVAGFEKVKDWIDKGRVEALFQARDGSERGKSKLRPRDKNTRVFNVLEAQELGLAFGRENVIHCALSSGGLTARVVEEAARLTALRETDGRKPAGKGTKTT